MNRKSILAIERINNCIIELKIITAGKDFILLDNEFEMPIICGLVNEIDKNIFKINAYIKDKYNNINWNIIESRKENNGEYKALKLGKVWELANGVLYNELYKKLNNVLEAELPTYYKNYCNRRHENALKHTIRKRYE